MSNNRFLEINSTYRDRNTWPSPAQFEIAIAENGQKDKNTAKDPVSDSTPLIAWNAGAFDAVGDPAITVVIITDTMVNANDNQLVNVETTVNTDNLQQTLNYYVGAVAIGAGGSNAGVRNRIIGYRYLGQTTGGIDRGEFIFDGSFTTGLTGFTITDPSNVTVQSAVQLFVPAGRSGDNAYPNLLLYNETLQESAPITAYSEFTHIVEADASAISGFAWDVDHAYSIRKKVPVSTGVTTAHSTSVFTMLPTASTSDGFYTGDFFRVIDTDPTPANPIVAPIHETRRIIRYVGLSANFASPAPLATNSFVFNRGSSVNSYYVGCYIITSLGSYLVLTYDGATKSGTISGVFGGEVLGSALQIRTAFVSPAFTVIPVANGVELMMFSRDNYNALGYSGSIVSQQQEVCYEIELFNLILPNRVLNVGHGSRIAFYPYLYVEFSNISTGNYNIIYSNNPNATKMLFRVPLDDTQHPLTTTFVKLDGDGMVQTIKFKPNETLHFAVRLPNGELFANLTPESFSPAPPNDLIQISAMFSLKRL